MPARSTLRICPKGHRYYKSSACPVCPLCEQAQQPVTDFLAQLAAPARRALKNAGIDTLEKLSSYTESALLKLHGFGKSSLAPLQKCLAEKGLSLQKPASIHPQPKEEKWFREQCLALDDVTEQPHFEKTSFRSGNRIFATYDATTNRACLKLTEKDQALFTAADGVYPVPNKWGQQGWTLVELSVTRKQLVKSMLKVAFSTMGRKKK